MDTSWPQQGLGPWRQQQNMQHGCVQSAWAGPLTGGERVPAGEGGAPSGGEEEEEPRGGPPDL